MSAYWDDVEDDIDPFNQDLEPRERAVVLCRAIDRHGSLGPYLVDVSAGNFPPELREAALDAEEALIGLSDAVTKWCAERGIEWP